MPEFLLYALLAGFGIALVAGPLGAFVVWRRMAYFGDTLAHSALIGIALALVFDVNITLGIVFSCGLIGALLVVLEPRLNLTADTLLGILSHGALALGLVCVSFFSQQRINLFGYLFGDFLTVTPGEIAVIFTAAAIVIGLIAFYWKDLLAIAIDEETARVEGRPVDRLRLLLMLMMAVVVALAMKIVGVLLITALLIIPAATGRRFAKSPEAMATMGSLIAMLAVIMGLCSSYFWDVPAGPAIVLSAALMFFFSMVKPAN